MIRRILAFVWTFVQRWLGSSKEDKHVLLDRIKHYGFYPALIAGVFGIVMTIVAGCSNWVNPLSLPSPSAWVSDNFRPPGSIATETVKGPCD